LTYSPFVVVCSIGCTALWSKKYLDMLNERKIDSLKMQLLRKIKSCPQLRQRKLKECGTNIMSKCPLLLCLQPRCHMWMLLQIQTRGQGMTVCLVPKQTERAPNSVNRINE
jgi:hypothetical protein